MTIQSIQKSIQNVINSTLWYSASLQKCPLEKSFDGRAEMEEREQKRFVSSNRWPAEPLVEHYVRTYQLHGELRLEDGPKYYNHSLIKELYNAAGRY